MLAGIVIATVVAFIMPNVYVSTAELQITPAQVSDAIVKSTIIQQLNERIVQMQQDILSSTKLVNIITDPRLDLYKEERAKEPIEDVIEIEQLLARYAVGMTKHDIDAVMEVFTPDGHYSAFGSDYGLADFPALAEAAPHGLYLVGTPLLELDGDTGTGTQPLCFVIQTSHELRIGYYNDTYRRTTDGWRLHTRAMTFLRRSGARDSGKAHDPTRPEPSGDAAG